MAQLFLFGFEGQDLNGPIFRQFRRLDLGGMVIGPDNYTDPQQLALLAGEAAVISRQERHVPPWVMAAQEGGEFNSFPDLPPPTAASDLPDVRTAVQEAEQAGGTLKPLGVNGLLGPVIDVGLAEDPAVGPRAFSDEADRVAGVRPRGRGGLPAHEGVRRRQALPGPRLRLPVDRGGPGERRPVAGRAAPPRPGAVPRRHRGRGARRDRRPRPLRGGRLRDPRVPLAPGDRRAAQARAGLRGNRHHRRPRRPSDLRARERARCRRDGAEGGGGHALRVRLARATSRPPTWRCCGRCEAARSRAGG